MYQFVAHQSMSEGEPISLRVVEELADREGTDPAELQPPLHTVIDTDALDVLFESTSSTTRTGGTVEFRYRGYTVRVDGSGEIEIGETVSFTEQPESGTQSTEETIGN